MHPFFGFKNVIRLGWGWAGDYQNDLGKVGGSELESGGVEVHALDSVENTVYFQGISNAFYEHFTCVLSSITTRKCTVCTALSLRKMP